MTKKPTMFIQGSSLKEAFSFDAISTTLFSFECS